MARPREYALDDVVQKAMQVFWRQGYAATSMSDLYAATGLKPGNLYATFTDKESLFRQCFIAYAAHFRASLPRDLQGLAAITAWLEIQANLASGDPDRKGCLIINTAVERDQHSAATQALAQGRLAEIRDFFVHHLGIAIAAGQLAPHDVAAQADALTGTVVGIMAMGRAGADATAIANLARLATTALPRP